MRAIFLSTLAAVYLFGAVEQSAIVVGEVAKLRQKYEECKAGQNNSELFKLKQRNTEIERELLQKKGVIQSLERTLKTRDSHYRVEVERNQVLSEQTNMAKVSRIERKHLTDSLNKAKFEIERLKNVIVKTTKERTRLEQELSTARAQVDKFRTTKTPSVVAAQEVKKVASQPDQSGKIKALQNELSRANALIMELQNSSKGRVQERVVTKVVEPTEKIVALQRELSAAQATIANLKKGAKVTVQERIVEKVVYKDRPSVKEKVVEKIVYKDRPVVQEKIIEKIVYKERPIIHEKVVVKSNDATEKLNRALAQKLAENEAEMEKLKAKTAKVVPPKTTKVTMQSVATPEKISKVLKAPELKAPLAASSSSSGKKSAPSAYRMATNAPVYSAPGGSVVDTWEERRSFTSGTANNGWIKITGYFVNRVWTRADQELWVKESDVIKR